MVSAVQSGQTWWQHWARRQVRCCAAGCGCRHRLCSSSSGKEQVPAQPHYFCMAVNCWLQMHAGSGAFWAMRQRMIQSPTGRRILDEQPRITVQACSWPGCWVQLVLLRCWRNTGTLPCAAPAHLTETMHTVVECKACSVEEHNLQTIHR